MSQLVGTECAVCRVPISDESSARLCRACGRPRHNACAAPPDPPADGRCGGCGGAIDPIDWSTLVPPPEPVPVARACPGCGGHRYKRVKPLGLVAFKWDRECKDCGRRYTPPTPLWAAFVFIGAGLALAAVGLLGCVSTLVRGGVLVPACLGFLGLVGVIAIAHGFRSLFNPGKV